MRCEDVGDAISDSISDLASIGSFDISSLRFGSFRVFFCKSALRSRERSRAFPRDSDVLLLRGLSAQLGHQRKNQKRKNTKNT